MLLDLQRGCLAKHGADEDRGRLMILGDVMHAVEGLFVSSGHSSSNGGGGDMECDKLGVDVRREVDERNGEGASADAAPQRFRAKGIMWVDAQTEVQQSDHAVASAHSHELVNKR